MALGFVQLYIVWCLYEGQLVYLGYDVVLEKLFAYHLYYIFLSLGIVRPGALARPVVNFGWVVEHGAWLGVGDMSGCSGDVPDLRPTRNSTATGIMF
jgi:hypothetical protein